jgi:hypothetical protein
VVHKCTRPRLEAALGSELVTGETCTWGQYYGDRVNLATERVRLCISCSMTLLQDSSQRLLEGIQPIFSLAE